MWPVFSFNSLVFWKCTHVWSYYMWTLVCTFQIDLEVFMYLERRYMYTYFEKVSFVFLYIMQRWTLLELLNIKSLHMHVQYLHVHTRSVPAPVAQSVECPLRETWGHGFDPGPRHTIRLKFLKMVQAAPRLALRLDVISCQVSGAWYFSDATQQKCALSSLSQPDTVVIWQKNCWKRR